MARHTLKLLVLLLACTVAPASAARLASVVSHGPECPYERARLAAAAAAAPADVVIVAPAVSEPLAGGMFGFGRSSIFAP